MAVWFEGVNDIACDIERVTRDLEDPGGHFVGVLGHLPGLTRVELVEQGDDVVVIRTNEGRMTRSKISRRLEEDQVLIEFDEEYQAGRLVTATSHFLHAFTRTDAGVSHRIVIRDVAAPGLLGFFYRTFGRKSMGNAFLKAYKAHLEALD